jgi:hypothetical protein
MLLRNLAVANLCNFEAVMDLEVKLILTDLIQLGTASTKNAKKKLWMGAR